MTVRAFAELEGGEAAGAARAAQRQRQDESKAHVRRSTGAPGWRRVRSASSACASRRRAACLSRVPRHNAAPAHTVEQASIDALERRSSGVACSVTPAFESDTHFRTVATAPLVTTACAMHCWLCTQTEPRQVVLYGAGSSSSGSRTQASRRSGASSRSTRRSAPVPRACLHGSAHESARSSSGRTTSRCSASCSCSTT